MPSRSLLFAALLALPLLPACASSSTPPSSCPAGETCQSPDVGLARGLRADGTVDVTAAEIWPDRGAEPAPLTPAERGEACAVLARCVADQTPAGLLEELADCLTGDVDLFWEERAVPTAGQSERYSFQARAVLAVKDDCGLVQAAATPRPAAVTCEEDGCWWESPTDPVPSVVCQGDVATLASGGMLSTRDCARAFARCDPSSPTGCTDRLPVSCPSAAQDRCDGALKIGCDETGRVSFHDCSRGLGGACGAKADGSLGCLYPDGGACSGAPWTCGDGVINLCVDGTTVVVPLAEAGMTACAPPPAGS